MHEIELGRLREGDGFKLCCDFTVTKHKNDQVFIRHDEPEWEWLAPQTRVLIDDATMERVKEREAKNAGQ